MGWWMLLAYLALQAQQPYFDFSKAGAGFNGPGRDLPDPTSLSSIRIGVLAPVKDPLGRQVQSGVALALEEANRAGGYRGVPFELLLRADDGPWGVAARQLVSLAYEDKVWTVIGGVDGNRTHIAELVASKAWVPVISPAASDSSVDYANVPWVFRCVPADSRQAALLLEYARRQGYKRIVALTEMERDAYAAFARLNEEARRERRPLAAHLQYPAGNPDAVLPQFREFQTDAVMVWGSGKSAIAMIKALRRAGARIPVLGPSTLAGPELTQAGDIGEVVVAAPCDLLSDDAAMRRFAARFRARTGSDPSAVAMYAYDAARLTVHAILRTGLNRARIRDELAGASFQGITGKIEFNSLRGNTAAPVLLRWKDGRWVK